jgi:hypothetical protein
MGLKVPTDAWGEDPKAAKIVKSAKEAIIGILGMGGDVLDEHKRTLISRMLWKITEANGKYTTRFQSENAIRKKGALRHDHAWIRKHMVEGILAYPRDLDSKIALAIGCTVTKDEHDRLTEFDSVCDGWERYRRAKIAVWDLRDRKRISDSWK